MATAGSASSATTALPARVGAGLIGGLVGATYEVLFARWAGSLVPAAVIGLAYGVVRRVLGALLLMPAKLGIVYAPIRLRLHHA